MFEDRREAGRRLGDALSQIDLTDPVVFAIPRGGVVVAAEVAKRLDALLDVIVAAKIRAPHQPELGLGAVAPDGSVYLEEETIRMVGVPSGYLEQEIDARRLEILRRMESYRGRRDPPQIQGRSAIIVDDGIATGGTAIAAARAVGKMGPKETILAVPVAPAQSIPRLEREVDRVVCLSTPEPFLAVGRWYRQFDQVSDENVRALLQEGVNW